MPGLSRFLAVLTMAVAGFGIALPLAPLAIAWIAPPLRAAALVEASRLPDGGLSVAARIDKRWCVFRGLGFAWRDDGAAVWRTGYRLAEAPRNADLNRPSGTQTAGPWLIPAPPAPEATRLTATVRHRCGLIDVTTRLGEVRLEAVD